MALQEHLELSDIIKQFEDDFFKQMELKRDQLWEMMKESSTKESDAAYSTLNAKVIFLQAMIQRMRTIIRYDAVLVNKCEYLTKAFAEGDSVQTIKLINDLKNIVDEH